MQFQTRKDLKKRLKEKYFKKKTLKKDFKT